MALKIDVDNRFKNELIKTTYWTIGAIKIKPKSNTAIVRLDGYISLKCYRANDEVIDTRSFTIGFDKTQKFCWADVYNEIKKTEEFKEAQDLL